MANLVNTQTNQVEDIPQDNVAQALLSGSHNLAANQPVNVVNPSGELVSLDAHDVPSALANGYSIPSQSKLTDFSNQQKFGEGLGNELKAFGAGAARSATFGLSDQALTKSGMVDPDTLANLSKYNPGSTMAGEATGVVAPMLAGDELGAANLVKGVSGAGHAIEGAVAGALPEATGLAGKIISSGAAKAAGSAVEGAAYGAGQVVSEQALGGDPGLNAEKAMAQIGLSGLLGGGLGAVIGAGEVAVPPIVDAAKSAISNTYDAAKGIAGDSFVKASSAISGLPEESISQALADRQAVFTSPEERLKAAESFTDALSQQYNKVEDVIKSTNRDIRPIENEVLTSQASPEAAQHEVSRVLTNLNDTIDTMRAKPDQFPGRFPSHLEDIRDGIIRDLQGVAEAGQETTPKTPADIFNRLNDLKQDLDRKIQFGKIVAGSDEAAKGLIQGLRYDLKTTLENPEIWGEAGSRQAAFNEAQNEYLTAKKAFEKQFMVKTQTNSGATKFVVNPVKVKTTFNQMGDISNTLRMNALERYNKASQALLDQVEESYKSVPSKTFDKEAATDLLERSGKIQSEAENQASMTNNLKSVTKGGGAGEGLGIGAGVFGHPVLGAALEAHSLLSNPGKTITRLANLERMAQKVGNSIQTAAKTVVTGSSKAYNVGRGEIMSGIAKEFGKDSGDSLKQFEKRTQNISMLQQNIPDFHQKLENSVSSLYEHAPQTSAALQSTAVAGVSFLASKIPQSPNGNAPLASEWQPSKDAISKFNRYYEAVENPLSTLKQAAAGTLTPEGVEAVATVYPKLYEQMNQSIFSELASKGNKGVPYKQRLMLSLFMGKDLDGSTTPQSIMANQKTFTLGPSQNKQQGAVRPSQSGLGKVDLSGQIQTSMQQSANRSR